MDRRGSALAAGVTLVLVSSSAPRALAQGHPEVEPGVSAVTSARAAIARLAAAATAPTPSTAAIGELLSGLAKPGEPATPVRGQALDNAAQPWLAGLEPRIAELRERILDRRHRFLTGEDRPQPPLPDLVTNLFDVRSILGDWRDRDSGRRLESPLVSVWTDPPISSRPIHVGAEKVVGLVDRVKSDAGSVEISGGALLVRATEEDQASVAALIDRLRAVTGLRVALEVGAYRLPREVRLAHAAASAPDEAERVLARALGDGTATLLASRTVVIEDGGLCHLSATETRSYLAGEDVNQTGVVPVVNPILSRLDLGLRGAVRATIAPGRGDVIVDLDVAFTELRKLQHVSVTDHELEMPDTVVTRCATTLLVPLGGSVLAGGTFSDSEDAASACVFLVKASRFTERAAPKRAPPAPRLEEAPPPSTRPEVADLDALLAIVVDALAKIRAARRYELRIFDVRDIVEGVHVRRAPSLGVQGRRSVGKDETKKMAGAVLAFGNDDSDYDAGLGLDPDKLEALVKSSTGADVAWGDPASYEFHGNALAVHQTPGELAAMERMLEALRKDRIGNVEISVDWCRVEDSFLAELTRGGSALSRDGLAKLEAALAAGDRASRTASGFVIAQRGDVAVLHGGGESTFVEDFEHASGGTGMTVATVGIPHVGLVRQGLNLEALGRGDVTGAEDTLTLGARLGLARVTELPQAHTPTGALTTPVLDDARTSFDGIAPSGALVLVVGRHAGEKRPVVVAVLRGRLLR
jgi:hypothetical protein